MPDVYDVSVVVDGHRAVCDVAGQGRLAGGIFGAIQCVREGGKRALFVRVTGEVGLVGVADVSVAERYVVLAFLGEGVCAAPGLASGFGLLRLLVRGGRGPAWAGYGVIVRGVCVLGGLG